jgi:hypothetical protein
VPIVPGVIAVLRDDDVANTVARAARPLLRRPWHALSTVVDAAHEACLGFAGSRGGLASHPESGVLLALDGEAVGESAEGLLGRYLAAGPHFEAPEGWFGALVWDPRTKELHAVTDRFGSRPVYVASRGRTLLVASELKALVAAGLEPRLDPVGWAELLAYEYANGSNTPLEGVTLVPPASVLTVSHDGRRRIHERWRYRVEPVDDADEASWLEELGRLLERAVVTRTDDATVLALSGGLDSRCLAAILAGAGRPLASVTYGAPGSEDLRIGAEVARRARLPHQSVPLASGYLAAGAAETVWLAEGQIRSLHSHHLVVRPLRTERGAASLLIGFAGDPVMRAFRGFPPARVPEAALAAAFHDARAGCVPDSLLEEILTPRFAAELRGLARESFARCFAEEEGDRPARIYQFVWRHNHRRKVLPGSELFIDDLAPRDPFADGALIELCRRMPARFRAGGYIQRAYLRRSPVLAALPNPKDGLAPALTGRAWSAARVATKARRRGREALDRALGPRWWPDRRGLGDYASDLRSGSSHLLDILLEPRTLARDQLREEAIRRLVRAVRTGRGRNTGPIGMLLTLELFQRQFLEGEPPPVDRATAHEAAARAGHPVFGPAGREAAP